MTDFEKLYEDHARDVYRFALYLSGDRAVAEDITSETFIRVWTATARVELATVRAYLLTIARNLYLHGQRRQWRRTEMPERLLTLVPGWTVHTSSVRWTLWRDLREVALASLLVGASLWAAYARNRRRLRIKGF